MLYQVNNKALTISRVGHGNTQLTTSHTWNSNNGRPRVRFLQHVEAATTERCSPWCTIAYRESTVQHVVLEAPWPHSEATTKFCWLDRVLCLIVPAKQRTDLDLDHQDQDHDQVTFPQVRLLYRQLLWRGWEKKNGKHTEKKKDAYSNYWL